MLEMLNLILMIPENLNPAGIRIRTAGTRVHPLWCMADWCQLLGEGDVSETVHKWKVRFDNDDDDVLARVLPDKKEWSGPLEKHETWYIGASEVFKLILGCELDTAAPFQEWLTSEVLPSIDEYGYYPPPSAQQAAYQRWLAWFDACFPRHYAAVSQLQPGGFSVLCAIKAPLIAAAEELIRQGLPVQFFDRPDIGVESWWKQRRKRNGLRVPRLKAPLELPEKGETVYVKVYGPAELDEFNDWFSREYLPGACPSLYPDEARRNRRTRRRS